MVKIKIQPDMEKAKGIRRLVRGRKHFVKSFKGEVFPTVICENYYEIIKELSTALFISKGVKFIGEYAHKELMQEIVKLLDLDSSFSAFLDDFRIRRNGSIYYGEQFEETYLENNISKIELVIKKIECYLDWEVGE
jgi:hypothetical protein